MPSFAMIFPHQIVLKWLYQYGNRLTALRRGTGSVSLNLAGVRFRIISRLNAPIARVSVVGNFSPAALD